MEGLYANMGFRTIRFIGPCLQYRGNITSLNPSFPSRRPGSNGYLGHVRVCGGYGTSKNNEDHYNRNSLLERARH